MVTKYHSLHRFGKLMQQRSITNLSYPNFKTLFSDMLTTQIWVDLYALIQWKKLTFEVEFPLIINYSVTNKIALGNMQNNRAKLSRYAQFQRGTAVQ